VIAYLASEEIMPPLEFGFLIFNQLRVRVLA